MNNIVNFYFDNFRIWFFSLEIWNFNLIWHSNFDFDNFEIWNFNFKKVGFIIKTIFNWMNNIVDDLFDHEPKYGSIAWSILNWFQFELKSEKILKI